MKEYESFKIRIENQVAHTAMNRPEKEMLYINKHGQISKPFLKKLQKLLPKNHL